MWPWLRQSAASLFRSASPPSDRQPLSQTLSRIEAVFSNLTVEDASGSLVSQGKAQVSDNTMRISLKPLNAGLYKVNWRAVSTDTHRIEGSFTFRVDAQ